MEHYEAIVKHPYIERQKKYFLLLQNVTPESTKTFMIVLDIAEELCTCSNERFKKLLPIEELEKSLSKKDSSCIEWKAAIIEIAKRRREEGRI